MRRNNLRKIILLVFIITIVLVLASIALASKKDEQLSSIKNGKWTVREPELFNNVGYRKLFINNSVDSVPIGSSEYIDKITNPFGIRDEALEFILTHLHNNESAIYAAIRMEQTQVNIYYAKTDKEAVQISNNGEIAIWCLAKSIGVDAEAKYIDDIDAMELSTVWGKKIDAEIRRKLGWKILGNHLSKEQMNKICEEGNY